MTEQELQAAREAAQRRADGGTITPDQEKEIRRAVVEAVTIVGNFTLRAAAVGLEHLPARLF